MSIMDWAEHHELLCRTPEVVAFDCRLEGFLPDTAAIASLEPLPRPSRLRDRPRWERHTNWGHTSRCTL